MLASSGRPRRARLHAQPCTPPAAQRQRTRCGALRMEGPLPQAWNSTLWSAVQVDVVEEGAKSLLKDIRALPKDIKDAGESAPALADGACCSPAREV